MSILDSLDYDRAVLDKKTYESELAQLQLALLRAEVKSRQQNRTVLLAFEGWDAAGKGGAIKRLTEKLDPRSYHAWPISAPSDEEKRRHYLWRFWTRLPERGRWGVFDRTWYGRVLVERVEGYCSEPEWRRAYREINEFERQLMDDGCTLVKIFLAITKDEQLRRFKERESNPYKKWKLGPDDWRNRDRWDDYVAAAEQMFVETSVERAPWTVIGANRKWWARLQVLKTVLKALEKSGA